MALMTRTQLRDAIKLESRLTDTDLDTMIYQIMDGVLDTIMFAERIDEQLVIDTTGLIPSAGSGVIALPASFQHFKQVRFSVNSGVDLIQLYPANDMTLVKSVGTPTHYLKQGTNIFVFPYSLILTTHRVYVDYYSKPTFSSDSDNFPALRLQDAFKQQVLARLMTWHSDMEKMQAMKTGGKEDQGLVMKSTPVARTIAPIDTRQPDTFTRPEEVR